MSEKKKEKKDKRQTKGDLLKEGWIRNKGKAAKVEEEEEEVDDGSPALPPLEPVVDINEEEWESEDESDDANGENLPRRLSARELSEKHFVGFLLTVRTSVTSMHNVQDPLKDTDYQTIAKHDISTIGGSTFKVQDFAPRCFEELRRTLGLNPAGYLWSWSHTNVEEKKSDGKSGSCFMYSGDKRFLLKTITKEEAHRLLTLLPDLIKHYKSYPNSILMGYLGLYKLEEGKKSVYFTAMPNVINPELAIKDKYDLKGSSVARKSTSSKSKQKSEDITMKDLDIKRKFYLRSEVKEKLLAQLKHDCEFLETHCCMDYSLLVAVHPIKGSVDNIPRSPMGRRVPGLIYFVDKEVEKEKKGKDSLKTPSSAADVHEPQINAPIPARSALKRRGRKRADSSADETLGSSSDSVGSNSPSDNSLSKSENGNSKTSATPSIGLPSHKSSSSLLLGHSVQDDLGRSSSTIASEESCQFGNNNEFRRELGGIFSEASHSEIYFIGLIDYLQKYNKKKKIANFAKSIKSDSNKLSTVEPSLYANRFIQFIGTLIESA